MNGKGDKRRPKRISREEEDLRWELIKATPSRKRIIINQLKEIKDEYEK